MNRKSLQVLTVLGALSLALPAAAMAQGGNTPATPAKAATSAAPAKAPAKSGYAHHAGKMAKLDLNTASREQLMKLPGITEKTAEAIIAARPLKNASELVSRNVLTKTEWSKIEKRATVRPERVATKVAPAMKSPEKTESKSGGSTP